MIDKKSSAVQRVFKSVVGPALGTSVVLLIGCSASTPSNNAPTTDKPSPVTQPEPRPSIPPPGTVVPASTQGAVVTPASVPVISEVGITSPRPEIPEPGKVAPPEKVGKIAPTEERIFKVGKGVHPEKPIQKVGTVIRPPGVVPTPPKVGTHMEVQPEGSLQEPQERPTRFTRRTTDESGGVLRTGFVGGRKLT